MTQPTRYHRGVDWQGLDAKLAEKPPGTLVLHAADDVGAAAHAASATASKLGFHLLAASSPRLGREQRADALVKLFAAWPALCREMAALEALAPSTATRGTDWHNRLRDFTEARRAAE